MRKVNQLKSGVLLSYLNMIIGNIIPLFYAPVMLRIMGQEEYGLYSLATSVTSYLSLMNMGIGTAVVRYLSKYRAKNDRDSESKMMGLFLCIFSVIAVLTLVVGIVLAQNIGILYDATLSNADLEKMQVLMVFLTINTALSFAFTVFTSVVTVHERFIFQQTLNILSTAIPPVINIILLYAGFGSVGLVLTSLLTSIATYLVKICYCVHRLEIKPSFRGMPIHMLKELFAFSFFVFLSNIVSSLHATTDKVIIGAVMGTSAVAIYNVGLLFRNIVEQISVSISSVLTPRVTMMIDNQATSDEMTGLMIRVGRVQFLLVGLVVGGFCAFGREFMALYAGENYWQSYYVAVLIMVPMVVPLIQNIGNAILMAKNKHKFRSMTSLCTAILNVLTTIWLVQYWGVIGASFTTCVCNCIGSILIMNWYYYKKIGLNIPAFWKNIISLAWIPLVLTITTLFVGSFVNFRDPILFLCGVAVYTGIYCCMIWPRLNEYEKGLIQNVLNRFKRGRK